MNFERGNSPKKAIGIGIEAQSVQIRGIYTKQDRVSMDQGDVIYDIINGPDGHQILEDIQKNGLKERHIPYHIYMRHGYIPIGWLKGRWVEYLKKYYYIPEINEV